MEDRTNTIKIDANLGSKIKIKDGFKLFGATTKLLGAVVTASINPVGSLFAAGGAIPDLVKSFGFETTEEQLLWKLISRSMLNSFFYLVKDTAEIKQLSEEEILQKVNAGDALDHKLKIIVESEEHYIKRDFFTHPQKLKLFVDVKPLFKEYIENIGFNRNDINSILSRLDEEFCFYIDYELRNDKSYKPLIEKSTSGIPLVVNQINGKNLYKQKLINAVDEKLPDEIFSLKEIYIPLRAYYNVKKTDTEETRQAILLDEYLKDWLHEDNKDDCIKLISGGPGYGKSTLLKMLAAKLAEENRNILFIPLCNFKFENEFENSINTFLNEAEIKYYKPLEDEAGNLIILFDGLDELFFLDNSIIDAVNNFLTNISEEVRRKNRLANRAKIKVIFSGRDVVVQHNQQAFNKEGQILKLLPYYIDDYYLYNNTDNIKEDQRDTWWKKYGKLKGVNYKGLPQELSTKELHEITIYPLLNYLLSLSYIYGDIDFSQELNLNTIYEDLLKGVYKRNYSDSVPITGEKNIDINLFIRLLEEIAIVAWHGNARKANIKDINRYFENILEEDCEEYTNLKNILEVITSDRKKGTSLLVSFYFCHSDIQNNSETFEFTHKSFSEYLTARRIKVIVKDINNKFINKRWNEESALKKWIQLFGPKELDNDIVKYIRNEFAIIEKTELEKIQETIIATINYQLKNGMPVERDAVINTYRKENQYAINTEKALFVMHSITADLTNKTANIEWQHNTDFGNLLNRLVEQRTYSNSAFILSFFNNISIKNQVLVYINLGKANLSGVNLSETDLIGADLIEADLSGANLRGTDLREADLREANLRGTDLRGTDLRGANLIGANLIGANLRETDLFGADLSEADLSEADLRGTDLSQANLNGAIVYKTKYTIRVSTLKGKGAIICKNEKEYIEALRETVDYN